MAKLHAVRIAAVFAANAELDAGARLLSLGDGHLHQLTYAGLINGSEWVFLHDFEFLVGAQEGAGIVAAHSERRLCEVVGAETEEFGGLRDFVGSQSSAWDFNHRTDKVVELDLLFLHDFLRDAMHDFYLKVELLFEADERNHNLRIYFNSRFLHFCCSFKDRTRLHLGDLRIHDAQTAAAESEHRIELMQFLNSLLNLFDGHAHFLREIVLRCTLVRQELMQRRIEEANRSRASVEFLEHADEVFALIRKDLRKSLLTVLLRVGKNHFAHRVDAIAFKE